MLTRSFLLRTHTQKSVILVRCCTSTPEQKKVADSIPVTQNIKITDDHDRLLRPKNVQTKVVTSFSGSIVKQFEKVLQLSPSVFEKYKQAKGGFVGLQEDAKIYFDVSKRMWQRDELKTFTRKELLVYSQMPSEMMKAVPLLVLCVIPFGFWLLPVAFMFPKLMLTSHFLTDKQLTEIQVRKLKWRLNKFPNVMDCCIIQMRVLTHQVHAYNALKSVVLKTKLGLQITSADEIIPTSRAFSYDDSYCVFWKMPWLYGVRLAGAMGMSRNRMKFFDQALILHHIDLHMAEEGLENISDRDIQMACFARGLNVDGMSRQEQEAFLTEWIKVSLNTNKNNIGMLLHSTVFFNYDAPTNVALMPKWFWKKRLRIAEK